MRRSVLIRTGSIAFATLLGLLPMAAPAFAARPAVSIRAHVHEVVVGHSFTLSGALAPARAGITVQRQVFRANAWQNTGTAATTRSGTFTMVVTAPSSPERLKLRVQARVAGTIATSGVVFVKTVLRLKSVVPRGAIRIDNSSAGRSTPKPVAARSRKPTPKPTSTPTPKATPSPTVTDAVTVTDTRTDTTTATDTATGMETVTITAAGPGKRILGIDISAWQHPKSTLLPNGAPIDFNMAYKNGVRFVIIKASDGRDNGHNSAAVWYAQDRSAAQAAGLYTGFYHYAYFPQTTVKATIIADAQAQADKAIWRLAAVGGYNSMDLPYALDVEEWCLATNDNGACMSRVTKANATLWVKTWLQRVTDKTGRRPFVYSNASFLENFLTRDTALRAYPLWIAHAGLKPGDASQFPGMKSAGTCFIPAWTLSTCQPQWSVWQYGIETNEAKYGIPGGNVDVDVFSGSTSDLLALTLGAWQPAAGDFLPFNETTTMTVSALNYSLTTTPMTFTVDVHRITGGPVVSGTVAFQLLATSAGVPPTPAQISAISQTVRRTASGTWTVSISGLPAGTWAAQVAFHDTSGVHAPSASPFVFTLIDPNPPVADTSTATDTATLTGTLDTLTATTTP